MKSQKLYMWVGSFAIILMAWLWVGPKLVHKPLGTPPRSGSNEEAMEMAKVQQGIAPQGNIPMGLPEFRRPAALQPLPAEVASTQVTAPPLMSSRLANRAMAMQAGVSKILVS